MAKPPLNYGVVCLFMNYLGPYCFSCKECTTWSLCELLFLKKHLLISTSLLTCDPDLRKPAESPANIIVAIARQFFFGQSQFLLIFFLVPK